MPKAARVLLLWSCLLHVLGPQVNGDGRDYIGIGYNLLKANPDGGEAARGGVDPGLLLTRRVLRFDPDAIKEQRRHSCATETTTSTFYGAKSYQSKLQTSVQLGGGAIAGLANFAFSLSPRFARAENETSQDHKVFQDEQNVCNLGHIRFAEELTDWLNVSVTDSFAASVCRLPEAYSEDSYMKFLDDWGTHMTVEVDIGTKVIHRSQTSLAEFVRHVASSSGADVNLGGTYMGFGASLKVNFDNFRSSDTLSQSFGSHSYTLQAGSEDMPEPISVTIVSIDAALQARYWRNVGQLAAHSSCTVSTRTEVIAANLRHALSQYAAFKMAAVPTDPPLIVPLTWPRGTYGLIKPLTGCPGGRVTWDEGWRYQDTGDIFFDRNTFSSQLHLAGSWRAGANIRMDFCMKGVDQLSEWDVDWPAGDYCVFKYGACPTGFQSGFVQWDDADVSNDNSAGGILPDGVYNTNTKIFFCCRSDGLPTKSIYMPPERPFYLLRHTRACQHVHNMALHEETVQWDEAFGFFGLVFSSEERLGGIHPFDDGDKYNHRLHFCYYYPITGGSSLIG